GTASTSNPRPTPRTPTRSPRDARIREVPAVGSAFTSGGGCRGCLCGPGGSSFSFGSLMRQALRRTRGHGGAPGTKVQASSRATTPHGAHRGRFSQVLFQSGHHSVKDCLVTRSGPCRRGSLPARTLNHRQLLGPLRHGYRPGYSIKWVRRRRTSSSSGLDKVNSTSFASFIRLCPFGPEYSPRLDSFFPCLTHTASRRHSTAFPMSISSTGCSRQPCIESSRRGTLSARARSRLSRRSRST